MRGEPLEGAQRRVLRVEGVVKEDELGAGDLVGLESRVDWVERVNIFTTGWVGLSRAAPAAVAQHEAARPANVERRRSGRWGRRR